MAKEPGQLQAEAMEAVRREAKRNPLLAQKLGVVPAAQQTQTGIVSADPDQVRLQRIESLVKRLNPEVFVAAPNAKAGVKEGTQDSAQAKTGVSANAGNAPDKRLAAIGPDFKVEIQQSAQAKQIAALTPKGKARTDAQSELRQALAQQAQAQTRQLADFSSTRQSLQQLKISEGTRTELLARHDAAMEKLQARSEQFSQLAQAVQQAPDSASQQIATAALAQFFKQYPASAGHTASDPKHLPWGSPSSKVRAPIENEADYSKQSAALGFQPGLPMRKLAGGFGASPVSMLLPGISVPTTTPVVEDMAPTEDVQLTPAIIAKATELNKDPVKIYNWVRNNIEFIPSYGSIQGSDLTLKNQRGNAFDTASLLIALLRASNISARYVYGTVRLPIEQAKNWVGGVTAPAAVQSLLGQGGIPNILITSGGQVTHVKLEHVWVEAWVDYIPSRGAKHKDGDSWIPMDASYKQYQYTAGMNIKQGVPLDAAALQAQLKTGATLNEAEGWVQNLNSAALQSTLSSYQAQVKTYVDTQKPGATVGDVLGTKKSIVRNDAILLGSLPYPVLATGGRFASIPDSLRWKYRTQLVEGSVDYFGDVMGTDLVSLSQSTASLAAKKITISFTPATQADTDLINSYLPKPHADGTPIQPSELPSSLPGYLLKLKAEIRVNGQLISQSTTSVSMGTELLQATAMYNPGTQAWEEGEPNKPIAGGYHAIALDLQGVAKSQLEEHKAKLQVTQAKLQQYQANTSDTTSIQGLSKEDLSGDLLYSGILGYFASVDGNDQFTARSSGNIVAYRLPSYGAFMANAQPRYWFGIVRSVSFPGMMMDVDRVFMHVEAKDMDKTNKLTYMRQVGSAGSAFEHAVPEKLFADPLKASDDPSQPQGVSAVKALALAGAQGQKIYTLTQANAASLSQISIDEDARSEISSALQNGKEVTVHEKPITQNGWVGSGYIVLDQDSGAGAYKISGGANGGFIGVLLLATGLSMIAIIGVLSAAPIFIAALLGILSALVMYLATSNMDADQKLVIAEYQLSLVILAMALLAPFVVTGLGMAAFTVMLGLKLAGLIAAFYGYGNF
ncbi:transglutaminase-like domain-containing protein [Uliginosibacterium sp. 31-16]|uniref:transglutaminase-like domain-containing protein n=1 Tax=Uliginosibacterium sp. 31-16 TaxID=3068315 RepID=UPI00273F5CB8|nr:transglutaminase-like domain-containing protein [Uliginosibacterium sp. 31-16]MDP5241123.1 transglutaminase-like domain-containing protein [Uliginosibacterium sp. 31-16]